VRDNVLIKASVDVLKLYSIGKDKNEKSRKFLESFEHDQDRRKRTKRIAKNRFSFNFFLHARTYSKNVVCLFACLV